MEIVCIRCGMDDFLTVWEDRAECYMCGSQFRVDRPYVCKVFITDISDEIS